MAHLLRHPCPVVRSPLPAARYHRPLRMLVMGSDSSLLPTPLLQREVTHSSGYLVQQVIYPQQGKTHLTYSADSVLCCHMCTDRRPPLLPLAPPSTSWSVPRFPLVHGHGRVPAQVRMNSLSRSLQLPLADQALGHGLDVCLLDVCKLPCSCLDGYVIHNLNLCQESVIVGGLSGCVWK